MAHRRHGDPRDVNHFTVMGTTYDVEQNNVMVQVVHDHSRPVTKTA